jgi:hypothetical protein
MDDNANCGDKQPFPTSCRTGVDGICAGVDKDRVIIVTELESYLAFFDSFSSTLLRCHLPNANALQNIV